MFSKLVDLAHAPAVALFLIMVSVAGAATTLINLRNARLWVLRTWGQRASGVVTAVEIVTSPNGEVLRRPKVEFSTAEGQRVTGTPVVFRVKTTLAQGAPVTVSYARRRPTRMVVHGYDFRIREPIYAAAGVLVALGVARMYFHV